MNYHFETDTRLGIKIPILHVEWELIDEKEQSLLLLQWEEIKGNIPDLIFETEEIINYKQALLYEEEDFDVSCELNDEISELASIINDLWIWFRTGEEVGNSKIHS